jgi:hypothetical protein
LPGWSDRRLNGGLTNPALPFAADADSLPALRGEDVGVHQLVEQLRPSLSIYSVNGSHRRILRSTRPLRLDGGCLLTMDKTTPSPQLRTDLLLEC